MITPHNRKSRTKMSGKKEGFPMESSIGNTIYCCVSKGSKILYTYNGGDRELEAFATLCLEKCPSFHARYFHTVGKRTFGFLIEDGYTYLAIVDPSQGSREVLRFLEHVRDGFHRASKNGFQDELVPVIRRLMQTLESMSQPAEQAAEAAAASNDASASTKAPLLGKGKNGTKLDKKKSKDRVIEVGDVAGDRTDRGIKIDIPQEPAGAVPLQKTSSSRIRGQQMARRLWWRHVKIVIAVDALLCLVLFGIWLAVCKGFECVSS